MLRIVRGRGWHCSFTRGCVFESLGPGYQEQGTNLVFCRVHRHMAELMNFTRGREGAEGVAQLSVPKTMRQGA
jgi:hypothetical protein